jgi:membrane protease YdiL (CAAX protease family)
MSAWTDDPWPQSDPYGGSPPEEKAGDEPQSAEAAPEEAPVDLAPCWRCGLHAPLDAFECPHCRAPLRRAAEPGAPADRPTRRPPILPMVLVYVIVLATSLIAGLAFRFSIQADNRKALPQFETQIPLIIGLEAVDTVLVFIAAVTMWKSSRTEPPSANARLATWALALPLLAGLLGLNYLYHLALHSYIGIQDQAILPGWRRDMLLAIVLICVQPAIVEELFFRRVTLGTLRQAMNAHAAVWISALMFGLAHIGAPLSIPMLTLLGVGLGYVRVASGSLVLPMLLHFGHNLAVVFLSG